MSMLFERRHFEWLARFAGSNLTPPQCERLASNLASTNAGFKRSRFLAAVERARAPDVVSCEKPARRNHR